MSDYPTRAARLRGDQMVFGWAQQNLEKHGVGNGVLGYSPGWPSELGVTYASVGRLVSLWGDAQAEPRGVHGFHIESLSLVVYKGHRVLIRKTPDGGGRAGSYFAHAVEIRDDKFTLIDALACWNSRYPSRNRDGIAQSLPNRSLAPIDYQIPNGCYSSAGRRPDTSHVIAVMASLLDVGADLVSAVCYLVHDPEYLRDSMLEACLLLPPHFWNALTFTTFEYQLTDSSPTLCGAISGFSKKSARAQHRIVELDALSTIGTPWRPSEQSIAIAEELVRLREVRMVAPDRITGNAELVSWIRAAILSRKPISAMSRSELQGVLLVPEIVQFLVNSNGFENIVRIATGAGIPLAGLLEVGHRSGLDTVSMLARMVLASDPAVGVEIWNQIRASDAERGVYQSTLEKEFISRLNSGRSVAAHSVEIVMAGVRSTTPDGVLDSLAAFPVVRQNVLTAPKRVAAAVARQLILEGDNSGVITELINTRPDVAHLAITRIEREHPEFSTVDALVTAAGVASTYSYLIKEAEAGERRVSEHIIRFVTLPNLTADIRADICRRFWPECLHWIGVGDVWVEALSTTLRPYDSIGASEKRPSSNERGRRDLQERQQAPLKRRSWLVRLFIGDNDQRGD